MRSRYLILLILLLLAIPTGILGIKFQEKITAIYGIKSQKTMTMYQSPNTTPFPVINLKINQYDSPPATFTGNFWDYGVDTDSNGRFDLLLIAVEINCTLESTFRLYIEISRSGRTFSRSVSFLMSPGIEILNVSFVTPPIHKQFFSSNEPLYLHVSYIDLEYITPPATYWLSDRLSYPYTTRSYDLDLLDIDPFPIDSNAFLSYIAAFDEWPGGGTKNDPYIINGSIINSLNRNLEVKNVALHFIVCNWILSQGMTGISLENVQNAIITQNDVSNFNIGIHLKDCSSILIERNKVHSNYMGIQVGTIPYLSVEPSHNVSIINNLFSHNQKYGVYINPLSQFNRIERNDFLNNNPDGSSQAFDQGTDNLFVCNYWSPLYEEKYSIDGSTQNEDSVLTATPNHLTTPIVLIPNGGESFTKQVVIQWFEVNDTFDQDITYSIYYSTDAGVSWYLLDSGPHEAEESQYGEKTCEFVWQVNNIFLAGDAFLIRIIAEDPLGFRTMDTSDSTFTIESAESTLSFTGNRFLPQYGNFLFLLRILGLGCILIFLISLGIVIKRQIKN
ncbi:MAG: right-handed parallel beta-helix repeat-containing protein [Candidatus Hodarchaeota archaeon]